MGISKTQESTSTGQQHLFIIGFYRSGTTLLYSLLNLHPQIRLVYEADILANPLVEASSWSGHKWWDSLDFYNGCMRRHGLCRKPEWNQARSNRQRADLLYRQFAGESRTYIGEKSPSYYNRLRQLARLYPDARFLVIWRDPQEVLASMSKAGRTNSFFKKRSLRLRSVLGLEKMQEDVLALQQKGLALFDFCYEELVEDTEGVLKSICAFLQIPFDPAMLELDHADSSMLPEGEHHSKAKSGHISRTQHAPDPSLGPICAKTERYITRWSERFGDKLASRRYWNRSEAKAPTTSEALGDRIRYQWTCLVGERITPFVFGLAPTDLLQRYRQARKVTV